MTRLVNIYDYPLTTQRLNNEPTTLCWYFPTKKYVCISITKPMVLTISSNDKTKLIIQNCLVNIYYILSDQYEQHTCQIGAWNHFLTLHHIKNGKDSFNSYRFRYFFSFLVSSLWFSNRNSQRNRQREIFNTLSP